MWRVVDWPQLNIVLIKIKKTKSEKNHLQIQETYMYFVIIGNNLGKRKNYFMARTVASCASFEHFHLLITDNRSK